MGNAPAGTGTGVRARIQAVYPDLAPAQQRVATFLLDNLAAASDYTITDLADATGVSVGTVSQLCRRLGLKGYQDLRLGLARDAVTLGTGLAATAAAGPAAVLDALARVFGASREALADTAAGLDPAAVEAAVARIAGARRVECAGVGTAGLVAAEAALKLRKLGIDAIALADAHQQAMSAALLDERDVLLAISHSGRTTDTLRAAEVAKEGGASLLVIGGPGRSPLAIAADILLVATSSDTGFQVEPMASTIAQLAIVQALFVMLLERLGATADDHLRRTQAAVEDRHITGRVR
ncbi:MAG: MurR/RpiR family transcriptional regulator [Chloroflexota bacterium]